MNIHTDAKNAKDALFTSHIVPLSSLPVLRSSTLAKVVLTIDRTIARVSPSDVLVVGAAGAGAGAGGAAAGCKNM